MFHTYYISQCGLTTKLVILTVDGVRDTGVNKAEKIRLTFLMQRKQPDRISR